MVLRQNILATLVYYDIFDWPLQSAEVVKFLVNFDHLGISFSSLTAHSQLADADSIKRELDQLVLDGIIGWVGHFYFLDDKEYLVPLRLKHEQLAKHKWRIARRAIGWLRWLPYVEAVFASGSLAMSNTDELSDLDVLVVVRHGRIWLTRLLITGILALLRVRRRGSDQIAPDKICLNHYISVQSLVIPFKSIYNAQTYSNLVPIYERAAGLIEKFKTANGWILDFVISWNLPSKPLVKNGLPEKLAIKPVEWFLDTKVGDVLENLARAYQRRRINSNPITKQTGGRVIFNDQQLEFHPHSIEASIIKKYNDRLIKLGMSELAVEHDSGLVK